MLFPPMPGKHRRQSIEPEEIPAGLFADAGASKTHLRSLVEFLMTSGSTAGPAEFVSALTNRLRSSPDPDGVIRNLHRFVDATVSKASLYNDLMRYPVLMEVLVTIFGHSHYLADILVRDPELFRWLTASSVLNERPNEVYYSREGSRIRSTFPKANRRLDAMRRLYRREVLRIGTRDVLGLADLKVTTEELSDLADLLIDEACHLGVQQLTEKFGAPPPTPFAVIGLGKLGGRELNYSSDIDIIFAYGEEGESTDPQGNAFIWHEYFNRLAEKVVQNLSSSSGEGHLYRVDTRLRPESGAGPLARSLSSYLFYYESRGELWERQMLIKARSVGGDREFGRTFIESLWPFVYPRTFFLHPAEAVARIKGRIEEELADDENIKLRPGGIRDIEFVAQTLQLLHGGKLAEVRDGNTLDALERLSRSGVLTTDAAGMLTEAYLFFRKVEHRLQMILNTQTHVLPRDPASLGVLARRLGMAGAAELGNTLNAHFDGVRAIFNSILASGDDKERSGLERILEGSVRAGTVEAFLKEHNFDDLRKAAANLRSLMTGSSLTDARDLDSRTREAFRAIAPALMKDLALTPVPDVTLGNLSLLASRQPFVGQFYDLLGQDAFRHTILRMCAAGSRFARQVAHNPAAIEVLVQDAGVPAPTRWGGSGDNVLQFKLRAEIRAGMMNLIGRNDFDGLTNDLTAIADVVIGLAFDTCFRGRAGKGLPVSLFALGKYGTREILFDADLDILLVAADIPAAMQERAEKAAQKFAGLMTMGPERGALYDLDLRLRPEGRNAPLVTTLGAYMRYLDGRASLWERQSLTRLRFVCGNETVGRAVLDAAEERVYYAPLPAQWTESIVQMRRTMETRSRTGRDVTDIKVGPGGIVDVEFTAQMIQLQAGRALPSLRGKPTRAVIAAAPPLTIPAADREHLISSYGFLRELEKFLRVALEDRGSVLPEDKPLELLAGCVGAADGAGLRDQVRAMMKENRRILLSVARSLGEMQA